MRAGLAGHAWTYQNVVSPKPEVGPPAKGRGDLGRGWSHRIGSCIGIVNPASTSGATITRRLSTTRTTVTP